MADIMAEIEGAGVPKEPAFSESEYAGRVARARKAMEAEGIDVLLVHHIPNLCYLTGYLTQMTSWYACVVLPREGDPFIHVIEGEAGLAVIHGWVKEVVTMPWIRLAEAPVLLANVLKERGFEAKRIGIEMSGFHVHTATHLKLREELPGAEFHDASRLVLDLRLVKSPAEIGHMREAARLTDIGLGAALAEIGPGKTENDVAAAAYSAMTRAGSEHPSLPPLVMAGHRSGWGPHLTWKRLPLKAGDPVLVELSGTFHRYGAPAYRTAVIGQPSDQLKRLADASLNTLNLIFENARPGRTVHELARAARKGVEPVASETGHHGAFGYSVGLGMVPTWIEHSLMLAEGVDRPLAPGMTFHTPVALRIPGKLGVGFSDTLVITETGCEALTKTRRELTVVAAS